MLGVSAVIQTSSKLLEVIEDLAIIQDVPGSLASSRPYFAFGEPGIANNAALFVDSGATYATFNGHVVRLISPGTNQLLGTTGKFGMPLKRDLSVIPASFRRQHRFTWDTVVQRVTALIAGVKCEIGLKDDPALSMEGPGATVNGGICLSSVSTRNAGAWTLLYYLTNGGVLQIGASSGVVPDGTPQHFRFEYFDVLTNPYLNIWINGALKFTIQGALLPVVDGQEPLNISITSGDTVTNTLGQVERNYGNRFMVELIG